MAGRYSWPISCPGLASGRVAHELPEEGSAAGVTPLAKEKRQWVVRGEIGGSIPQRGVLQ
jgi:hypothetical protein